MTATTNPILLRFYLDHLLEMPKSNSEEDLAAAKQANADNLETISDAIFDQLVNPRSYDPLIQAREEASAGMVQAAEHLGQGIAWAGFWLGLGAVLTAAVLRFAA